MVAQTKHIFRDRDPTLFENYYYRQFWGVTWEPIPYYSIFLVLVISVLRTFAMIKPLTVVPTKLIIGILIGYICFLEIRFWIGMLAFGDYTFSPPSAYCFINITNIHYQKIDLYLAISLYSLPIIPIILSSIISVIFLFLSSLNPVISKNSKRTRKHQATITVLIFTSIYIVCNIPVFITSLWFSLIIFYQINILDQDNNNYYLKYYNWLLSYIILVQVNAGLNPIVYFTRMRDFRRFVFNQKKSVIGRSATIIHSFRMNDLGQSVTQSASAMNSKLSYLRRKGTQISPIIANEQATTWITEQYCIA